MKYNEYTMKKYILVSNFDKVEKENFYLTNEWGKKIYGRLDEIKEARKLQEKGNLYYAYIVPALSFAIYWQMDAQEVFINSEMEVVLEGESSVIDTNFNNKIEYQY